jgi:hypothetical protein
VRSGSACALHNLITPNVDGHRTIGSEEPSAPSASAALLQSTRGATVLSTEPSTDPLSREGTGAGEGSASARCTACDAPIASDQRYCLQCGERLAPISGFLLGRGGEATREQPPEGTPLTPPGLAPPPSQATAPRSNVLGVLAGVGVLLLAMGVGVLIGRAGNSRTPAKPEVITQLAPASSTGAGAATAAATFTSDWPGSRSGYTVQVDTLPSSSTVAAVQAAKTAAGAKGAPAVGALASGEFSSLPAGHYVIYSGVFQTAAEGQKALASLKGKFPGAKVIHVSSTARAAASSSHGSSGGGSTPSAPSSITHPAKVPNTKGKNGEEASKDLPEVVETE